MRRVTYLFAAMALIATACSSTPGTTSTAPGATTTAVTSAATAATSTTTGGVETPTTTTEGGGGVEGILAALPPELAVLYTGYQGELSESVYADFGPVEGPWKICHSESFQGNPWRIAVTNELERLVNGLKAAGKVSSFELSDSNMDVTLQITQVQTFIDEGCTVITMFPGSATGLNGVIAKAYEAGIPVVTFEGAATSPFALNVDSNWYRWAFDMATGIGERVGEGNIIAVEGIAGHPLVAQQAAGRIDALANYPGIKVVAKVHGDWTPTTTKNVILQALATNPAEVAAVWTTGSETKLIAQAFVESGRDVPLVTGSISGDALGYWKQNPDKYRFYGNAVLPLVTAQSGFRVMVRLLEGQGPKLNTLLRPLPEVTQADLGDWWAPCMTPDSATMFPRPPSDPLPDSLLDAYFVAGRPTTPPFDYSATPSPCG